MDLTGLGSASELGSNVVNFASKLVDKIWPDPAQKAAAMLEVEKLHQSGELAQLAAETDLLKGQLDINKIEASSTSLFIAGWRPAIGWTCGFALLYASILNPIGQFVADVALGYKGAFPIVDTSVTMQVLFGMLGLAGMRSYEKVKGAEGNR